MQIKYLRRTTEHRIFKRNIKRNIKRNTNGTSNGTSNGTNKKKFKELQEQEINNPPNPPFRGGIIFSENQIFIEFEKARKNYPGVKRGFKTELEYLKKKYKTDWKKIIWKLFPAIEREKKYRLRLQNSNMFLPEWKHFKTWISFKCWENEFPDKLKITKNGINNAKNGISNERIKIVETMLDD